jgi:hypothetical protein
MNIRKIKFTLATVIITAFAIGCSQPAAIASRNLSTAADNFEIDRKIVFYDSVQGSYILMVEGRCSIEVDTRDNQLEVVCKTGPNEFKKHFLGLSSTVTYFAEQIREIKTDTYQYRVVLRPEQILSSYEVDTSVGSIGKK